MKKALCFVFGLMVFSQVFSQTEDVLAINIAPYIYNDSQGKPTGSFFQSFVDLAKKAGNLNTPQIVPMARAMQAQKNTVIAAWARTPERESLYKWGVPVYKDKFVFFARKGTVPKASSLADLASRSTMVLRGGAGEGFLKSSGFSKVEPDPDVGTSAKKLANKRADLWYTAYQSGLYTLKVEGFNPDDFEVVFEGATFFNWLAFTKDVSDATVRKWIALAKSMGLEKQ